LRREANRRARRAELESFAGSPVISISPGSAIIPQPQHILVASWTSSGGLFYYDLVHNLGREQVLTVVHDTHTPEYLMIEKYQPIDTTTLRLWLAWNPGADRIRILYF
jgi:hypothetical protein